MGQIDYVNTVYEPSWDQQRERLRDNDSKLSPGGVWGKQSLQVDAGM